MEVTKRRSFVQKLACLFGGAVGASAIQRASSAAPAAAHSVPSHGTIKLHLDCRHRHRSGQQSGHLVCGGDILDKADGATVGQFYANCFSSESTFGTVNPFAASNIEMHTIRLADGMIFGMGASNTKTERERAHAIIGGTGRFAGARGTYLITDSGPRSAATLTLQLLG